jgi:isopenicillin N synthase-like dioxygenase
MIIYTPPKPADHLPVVDLTNAFSGGDKSAKAVAWEIHKACRETGFFYVSNHGVSKELMDLQLAWTSHLFDLPMDEKMAMDFSKSPRRLGYEPALRQILDEGSAPDLKESYMYNRPLDPAGEDSAQNFWPATLPGFREQMHAYHAEIGRLSLSLMGLVALSLDLPQERFTSCFTGGNFSVRLLRYAPQTVTGPLNQLGAGAHTDWGAITLLLQDQNGGLEVKTAGDQWIKATPVEGTFVVNLGDLVRRWTNDLYQSTLHRVLNNSSGRNRHSVATFFSPRPDVEVSCLPTCKSADEAGIYESCTVGEHMKEMARKTYALA